MGSLAAAEPGPEITAFLGYREGASLPAIDADAAPSLGLGVAWWVRQDAWLEVFYDRQTLDFGPFDLHVDYLQLGGAYEPPGEGLRPYVTVAAGLSWYDASPGSVDESLGLSGSIGAGFRVPLSPRFSFRLEARGWGILASGSTAVVCGPGCAFAFSGEGWWQIGARAAIAYRPSHAPP